MKSHVYFGYTVLCTDDTIYNPFVRIFVRELVTDGLDVSGLVTDGPDVSKNIIISVLEN